MAPRPQLPKSWDLETDVLVVGYGFAGGIAAIEARERGAEVLLIEKARHPGGISICSGGGVRIARDADRALAYLQATCGGMTPTGVLRAMARGMTEAQAYMGELGRLTGARLEQIYYPGNYPFPGGDDLGFCMFGEIPGFDQLTHYPHVRGLRGGARHFKVMEDNVRHRGVRVLLDTAARRLLQAPDGRVVGLEASSGGAPLTIRARRGVILACGGFEADEDLKRQFLQGTPLLPAAYRGNTGDGIRMAQDLGAPLWHMWNAHGSYGFRHPDPAYPFGLRLARLPDWLPGHPIIHDSRMAWIVVDQGGRRFMNEYPPYLQDTGHRALEWYDPVTQRYPRIPSFMILDEAGRGLYPLSIPTFNDPEVFFEWSEDNSREVELGILHRAATVDELAGAIRVDPGRLRDTLARWNASCATGADDDHGRLPETMVAIERPPFYWAEVWPIVSNTQGGPVHDEHWRILDVFGDPIPGLYEAGELGGIFGFLYLAAGNLAECYVGGWTAARHAAASEPW